MAPRVSNHIQSYRGRQVNTVSYLRPPIPIPCNLANFIIVCKFFQTDDSRLICNAIALS
jgi:hypothetical protein